MTFLHLLVRTCIAISAAASIGSAAQTISSGCSDSYNYMLEVQTQEGGAWLSFQGFGQVPLAREGGEKVLMLSVTRVDARHLLVDGGYITGGRLKYFSLKVVMDVNRPTPFAKTFRPTPDLPVFGVVLNPVCNPA